MTSQPMTAPKYHTMTQDAATVAFASDFAVGDRVRIVNHVEKVLVVEISEIDFDGGLAWGIALDDRISYRAGDRVAILPRCINAIGRLA